MRQLAHRLERLGTETAFSVAQAAERLGVSVPRIHQRIADGSLSAERIGSQWAVDERSLLRIQERSKAGRPYSARSAWAIIAASEDGLPALSRVLTRTPFTLLATDVTETWPLPGCRTARDAPTCGNTRT